MHSFLHREHCVRCQISNKCTDGCVHIHLFDCPYHAATDQTAFHDGTSEDQDEDWQISQTPVTSLINAVLQQT